MIEAFPLQWPDGYKRTPESARFKSRFTTTIDRAQKELHRQIDLLGADDLIVSTNLPVRNDGLLYSDWMRRKIDDPGVAIYFKLSGEDQSLCCDNYPTVWENIYALAKGVEALRGIERWGISEFLKRAFTGFKALPPSSLQKDWWVILGVGKDATFFEVREAYLKKAKKAHPDAGGSAEQFQEIQKAWEEISSLKK
jgi:hypothetical protein